jgi:hypothetical protein
MTPCELFLSCDRRALDTGPLGYGIAVEAQAVAPSLSVLLHVKKSTGVKRLRDKAKPR